ncbi:FAD-dependent pyridine nucleotide-disulfide oxidoreductase [Pusillimonas sp. T7-7]|uniref:NAD(P)/FAD-dependent oxidoreductase n=1 Tax=Pusillimonas sp. (strain T7-7) TaxID=1007105 RepID=UPI0002084F55|nr:FAD-dependent oxidoreductase [Pusillimonas sp. T7-7]AEC21209.1 FAD-dependent pyridine nucleotide-disulfide oxidoreductase [Pusillimonas sp. T7-7]
MVASVLIIGGGHAGFQTAFTLRQNGYLGKLVIVDNETSLPYQRPPLSKAYMKGEINEAALAFKPEKYYIDHNIERIVQKAVSIDRDQRTVLLADGTELVYENLVLATGARNRQLAIPGADLEGVFGLRTLADAKALAARLPLSRSVVVIGAGFIGLEFAVVANAAGAKVQIVELADRVMARAVSVPVSSWYSAALAALGIQFQFGKQATKIVGRGAAACGIETNDGTQIDGDIIVYGIGVIPNTQLASDAGLACNNGIVVDKFMTTNDPYISAIGDCACFPDPVSEQPLRLESVQNANDQARCLANKLLGKPSAYTAVPWFWTEQGALKLQIAGISNGHDQTLTLGNPESHKYSVLCFREGTLQAVESTNSPLEHMIARRILSGTIRPTREEASAPGFSLKEWEAGIKSKHTVQVQSTSMPG